MKIAAASVDRTIQAPDPHIAAFLVYGPDRGLARERVAALLSTLKVDTGDPFAFADIDEGEVKSDPARLPDELRALSFAGGPRAVRVRISGDAASAVLASVLAELDSGALEPAAALIVEADDLQARSKTRKAFEGAKRGAAMPCYADGPRDLARLLDDSLAEHGLAIHPDARDLLIPRLAGDRALARAELEKLALYAGPGSGAVVSVEDVEACAAGAETGELDAIAFAAASGDTAAGDHALTVALDAGLAPIGVCRALQRHLTRLQSAKAKISAGATPDAALQSLRPPVFGPKRAAVKHQLTLWSERALSDALAQSLAAERRMKSTGAPDRAIIGRLVLAVSQSARRR